jgi:hypothetical protein
VLGALATVFVAGDRGDQLVVAPPDALYVEAGDRLRRVVAPAEIRGLAAAGVLCAWVAEPGGCEGSARCYSAGSRTPVASTWPR